MANLNIETMAKHYLICAMWADKPEGTYPRVTKSAEIEALKRCTAFAAACGPLLDQLQKITAYGSHPDAGSVEAAMGHDFYLTSCGHGTGFWDRKDLTVEPLFTLSAIDRDGKHYATSAETLGEVLSNIAYGTNSAISPFAYQPAEFYRGWLYL